MSEDYAQPLHRGSGGSTHTRKARATPETPEVAEACLSHRVGSAVSRAYARSDMLERRRPVMAAWAQFLEGGEPSTNDKKTALEDNVIELVARGA